jgi:hypothetical protein
LAGQEEGSMDIEQIMQTVAIDSGLKIVGVTGTVKEIGLLVTAINTWTMR